MEMHYSKCCWLHGLKVILFHDNDTLPPPSLLGHPCYTWEPIIVPRVPVSSPRFSIRTDTAEGRGGRCQGYHRPSRDEKNVWWEQNAKQYTNKKIIGHRTGLTALFFEKKKSISPFHKFHTIDHFCQIVFLSWASIPFHCGSVFPSKCLLLAYSSLMGPCYPAVLVL